MNTKVHTKHPSSYRRLRGLDWAKFFYERRYGPYLGLYHLAGNQPGAFGIGIVTSSAGIVTVITQTPAVFCWITPTKITGDSLHLRMVAICCILMTIPVFVDLHAIVFFKSWWTVLWPAVAGMSAIPLGAAGCTRYVEWQDCNGVVNHAGNAAAAALVGLLGHFTTRTGYSTPWYSSPCTAWAPKNGEKP
jgi:hypothetical protein